MWDHLQRSRPENWARLKIMILKMLRLLFQFTVWSKKELWRMVQYRERPRQPREWCKQEGIDWGRGVLQSLSCHWWRQTVSWCFSRGHCTFWLCWLLSSCNSWGSLSWKLFSMHKVRNIGPYQFLLSRSETQNLKHLYLLFYLGWDWEFLCILTQLSLPG